MAVLAIKTEPKCKLCKHEKRAEIDAILELRSALTRDPVTRKLIWNLAAVCAQLTEWGVVNPTEENIKNHWKKHSEVIRDDQVVEHENAALVVMEELREGGQHADTDENLRLIGTLWHAQTADQIKRGEMPKIPHDIMLKAAAELTRRASSETQHTLLTMFVGATGEALKTLATGAVEAKRLGSGEVVEGVEVAEFTTLPESAGAGSPGVEDRKPLLPSPDADSGSADEQIEAA